MLLAIQSLKQRFEQNKPLNHQNYEITNIELRSDKSKPSVKSLGLMVAASCAPTYALIGKLVSK